MRALAILLALSACMEASAPLPEAPVGTWVTPKGQPIAQARCDTHAPSKDGGPDVCFDRLITGTSSDAEACKADHGYSHALSLDIGTPRICEFPHADVGNACREASDCEVACDAETRTCSNTNLFGTFLDEDGKPYEGGVI